MRIIRTPADMEPASPIRERLDLLYLAPILIIGPGDTEQDIIREIGFSPLLNRVDGARFPSADFTPSWEYILHHEGWHELAYVTGDDGSGVILFIKDAEGTDPTLLALCRQY